MTRRQFLRKHHASIKTAVDGAFATTSTIADLRRCAEAIDSAEMRELAKAFDDVSEATIRMITKMPLEFMSIWTVGAYLDSQPNNATIKEKAA